MDTVWHLLATDVHRRCYMTARQSFFIYFFWEVGVGGWVGWGAGGGGGGLTQFSRSCLLYMKNECWRAYPHHRSACPRARLLNQLWSSDAVWWHESGSTQAQVMAWFLTAQSHYLNQRWLDIKSILCLSSESSFPISADEFNSQHVFGDYTLKNKTSKQDDQSSEWTWLIWSQSLCFFSNAPWSSYLS